MCRHLVWLGAPRSLASLLLDPEWSLQRQSYQPRRQDDGLVNADGYGIAWYDRDIRPEPARYRRAVPMWTDASLPSFGSLVRAAGFLAAVRSTALGNPVQETDTAPFVDGHWALSHNGGVRLDVLLDTPHDKMSVPARILEDPCDSVVLAARVFASLRNNEAAAGVLAREVVGLSSRDPGARLNLLLTDGTSAYATVWGASLSYLYDEGLARGGVLIASEPLDDDPAWIDVPNRMLLVADPDGVHVTELAELES